MPARRDPGVLAPGRLERHAALVALALAALEVALVLPRVGAQGIWFDEAVTVQNGLRPFDLTRNLRADATPPLYALAVRLWMVAFGASLESARTLSVVASAVGVALLFRLGTRLAGAPAALLAALLFVTSRFLTFFGHEARPYALVVLLCIASFAALVALLEEPRRGRVAVLAVLDAALLYTHYVAVFALVAQAVAACLHGPRERRVLGSFAASLALAGVLFLPLGAHVVSLWPLPMAGWLASPTPQGFLEELAKLAGARGLLLAEAILVLGGLAWIARSAAARGAFRPRTALLLASWAIVPLAAAFAASFVEPMFLARYLLYAAPGLLLLVAYVTASTPAPAALRRAVAAILVAWSLWLTLADPIVRPGWRRAAELVRATTARGGVTIVLPAHQLLPLGYHLAPGAFADPERLPDALRAARVFGLAGATGLRDARLAGASEVLVLLEAAYANEVPAVTRRLGRQGLVPGGQDALPGLVVLRYRDAGTLEPGDARGVD